MLLSMRKSILCRHAIIINNHIQKAANQKIQPPKKAGLLIGTPYEQTRPLYWYDAPDQGWGV